MVSLLSIRQPFENKWSRASPSANASAAQRQSVSQPATDHEYVYYLLYVWSIIPFGILLQY